MYWYGRILGDAKLKLRTYYTNNQCWMHKNCKQCNCNLKFEKGFISNNFKNYCFNLETG